MCVCMHACTYVRMYVPATVGTVEIAVVAITVTKVISLVMVVLVVVVVVEFSSLVLHSVVVKFSLGGLTALLVTVATST